MPDTMVSDILLEALAEVMDKIERGERTPTIVSDLDRDFSIPPTEGRRLVMFAYGLRDRIHDFSRAWSQPKERREQLLKDRLSWQRKESPEYKRAIT